MSRRKAECKNYCEVYSNGCLSVLHFLMFLKSNNNAGSIGNFLKPRKNKN